MIYEQLLDFYTCLDNLKYATLLGCEKLECKPARQQERR